jgi:hypothetical protein
VLEIKQWRAATQAEQLHVKDLVAQLNTTLAALEDARDEAAELRQRLGLPPGAALDLGRVKLQKEAAIAQLRSLNGLLERQVGAAGALDVTACWHWALPLVDVEQAPTRQHNHQHNHRRTRPHDLPAPSPHPAGARWRTWRRSGAS